MTLPRLFLSFLCLGGVSLRAQSPVREITLEDCRQLVLEQNLEIAARKMGLSGAKALYQGERGAFWEPVMVLGTERVSNERENNQEQFVSQGVDDFSEENRIHRAAIEQPLPTGGQLQLGYTLRDLTNNLREQRELEGAAQEFEGFLGVVFTQPLLKNAGTGIATSLIRMARAEYEAQFQEWRRQMMQTLGGAEAAYWDLYIAQRRVELRQASVDVAEKVLADNKARLEAGRMADVEVQQAEAGLALRVTQLLEARQNRVETANRLKTFFSETVRGDEAELQVTARPALREMEKASDDLQARAMELHPDVLIRKHRLAQDKLRQTYAENQVLPQLDFTATYGYNGLAEDSSDAFDETRDGDYVSWSLGVQLRVPLGGGRRSLGEREAARRRAAEGETGYKATEIALSNALAASLRRVANHHEQALNYQRVATLNSKLLETELARLEAGQSDSRKVLDTEQKLSEALEGEATSLTRFMVALLELELSSGTLLDVRGIDPMTDETR